MADDGGKKAAKPADEQAQVDDDEPDEWDKRILKTGCADENMRMTDCYYEKKDWRKCKDEMEAFTRCWKAHGNDERTSSQDAA
ncbi:hypothetical protein BD289DRAFT_485958 [Coniella lustricola]|uniref:CHCH domain-containing protein n=1 Tax=Coniella lustricola TaxID=2025994 RepID=A0A2T2ZWR7_9PEZI|nr:hypothetical protein BD289DRAFT_485958 [Coniella lustricola]